MTVDDFFNQVRSAFAYLESEFDFTFERFYPPVSFDNASVDFRSQDLAVTVGRERGQCFVMVGPQAYARYDLELLCRVLGDRHGQTIAGQERPRLEDLSQVLRRHLSDFGIMFSTRELATTQQLLEAAGKQRADEMFGPLT